MKHAWRRMKRSLFRSHVFFAFGKKAKKWWPVPESNWGHGDFQSPALPTELTCHIVIADYVYNIYPHMGFVKRFFVFFRFFFCFFAFWPQNNKIRAVFCTARISTLKEITTPCRVCAPHCREVCCASPHH